METAAAIVIFLAAMLVLNVCYRRLKRHGFEKL
jgi:hypothetical protein